MVWVRCPIAYLKSTWEEYVFTLNVENNGLRQMPLPSVEVADRKKSSPADSHEILHQQPTLPPSKLFNVQNMN